ncbi:MAG: anti-sigma factor family protein [Candidatus Rokuibacteriota bacterium]
MNCREFLEHLPPYVDGELGVAETVAVQTHLAECPRCQRLVEQERQFRQLLRRQPRESAPPEFRARVRARVRREAHRRRLTPWLVAGPAAGAAVAAAVLALVLFQPGGTRSGALLEQLVAQHIAFAQVEGPAEFATADPTELEAWLRQRAGVRATVPDYSPAGIRLLGARIAGIGGHKAAYVLYEKGHTLLSVFMVPASDREMLVGSRLSYRGHEYVTQERNGYRTVSWTEGPAVFGLVSMLDYPALLECADRLREARKSKASL